MFFFAFWAGSTGTQIAAYYHDIPDLLWNPMSILMQMTSRIVRGGNGKIEMDQLGIDRGLL